MANSTLKAVVVLDSETQGYKPNAHNLTAEAAVELAGQLVNAKVIDQSDRHRSSNPAKCKLCKQVAEQTTRQPETAAGDSETATTQ